MENNIQITELISTYYNNNYTGKILLKSSNEIEWQIYFFLGQLVWLNGGFIPGFLGLDIEKNIYLK